LAPGLKPAAARPRFFIEPHILLHEHGIGPSGIGRAGKDPDGMAGPDRFAATAPA